MITSNTPTTNTITHSGITWEQFTKINEAFDSIGGLRLTYCEGTLEIMPITKTHELVCALLTSYLHIYFLYKKSIFPLVVLICKG